jgi:hypothetical protein
MKLAIITLNREIRTHARIHELLTVTRHVEHCKFTLGYSLGMLTFAVMFLLYRLS